MLSPSSSNTRFGPSEALDSFSKYSTASYCIMGGVGVYSRGGLPLARGGANTGEIRRVHQSHI